MSLSSVNQIILMTWNKLSTYENLDLKMKLLKNQKNAWIYHRMLQSAFTQ